MGDIEPLTALLEELASVGRPHWRRLAPDVLPVLTFPRVQQQLRAQGVAEDGEATADEYLEAFEAAVAEAISTLADPVRTGAEILFGYRDPGDPPSSKTTRQGLAAEALSRSARWFRTPIERSPYRGATPHQHMVKAVAAAFVGSPTDVDVAQSGNAPREAPASATAHRSRPPEGRERPNAPTTEAPAAGRPIAATHDAIGPHERIRSLYVIPTPDEIDRGFWWRPSTERYIAQLAGLSRLTIFAGAEGDSDVGPPLHAEIASVLLTELLVGHPLVATLADERGINAIATSAVEALAKAYNGSTGWTGSVAAGLFRIRSGFTSEVTAAHLEAAQQKVGARMTTRGFVSSAITHLAFTLGQRGTSVLVVSDHWDDDLAELADEIADEVEPTSGKPSRYILTETRDAAADGAHEVPLIRLHKPGRPLVGEADYVTGGAQLFGTLQDERSRVGLMIGALSDAPALFVGTSLNDPGAVAALSATLASPHPRYALILPPSSMRAPFAPDPHDADAKRRALVDQALQLALVGARYLHLGVVPIFVDFPYQVPQFLREVARLSSSPSSDGSVSLRERFAEWWTSWAPLFGFVKSVDHAELVHDAQAAVHIGLRALREDLTSQLVGSDPADDDERLMIEVWLRNPEARYLFRWGSSEAMWLDGRSAPRASLREPGTLTQEAFREGHSIWRTDPTAAEWRCCLALNVVLKEEPYRHLPVGVAKVFSDRPNGALNAVVNGPERQTLEDVVEKRVRQLLRDAR